MTVGCPRGTYQTVGGGERVFNGEGIKEVYPVCQPCPVGSYQDKVASVDCKICPEYYQTRGSGSTAREDCYGELVSLFSHSMCSLRNLGGGGGCNYSAFVIKLNNHMPSR